MSKQSETNYYDKNFSIFYSNYLTGQAKQYAKFIARYLEDKEIDNSIIDFMCGTGDLLRVFEGLGWNTVGVDLSFEMIDIAQNQSDKTQYFNENVMTFKTPQTFGVAVSTADAFNHLSKLENIKATFISIYSVLKNKSYFIFDMNTKLGIRKDNGLVSTSNENMLVIRNGIVDEENRVGFTRFQGVISPNNNEKYLRFDSMIYNYMYSISDIIDLLKEVGFCRIELRDGYSNRTIPEDQIEKVERVLFIAQKDLSTIPRIRYSKVKRH